MATSVELTISPSTTRVGWIGTSVMGRSMCGHLLKDGYTLTVFNPTLSKAQPLIDLGAHLADSPGVVASQSDVIFSIVGYPSDVYSVLLDPTTGVLVDITIKNYSSIDAPIIGGDVGTKNGTLAILAGGEETIVRKLNPLFGLMSKVNYMGDSGKGQFTK